jgi:hypothetical protein
MVLPVEELTPSGFQDRLRATVSSIVSTAGRTGVKLPENFSIDFDKYQKQPPPAAAAGPLGRQLAALEIVMNFLLAEHVDSVTSLQRSPLPQESGGGARTAHGAASVNLVEKVPFEIRFTANQPSFQRVLNDFAASSKQFFITRTLVIENTDPKAVAKTVSAPAAAPTPGQFGMPTPAPGQFGAPPPPAEGAGGSNYLSYIVGTEKLDVAMEVDILAFNPPAKSVRKGAAPAR